MGKNNHALITGLFLILFLSASIGIIFWLGHFEKERNLYMISTTASVSGLNPESTVFFRGIPVGKVVSIQFDPGDANTILVPIEIDKNITLNKGVFATLHLKGVTGLTQIELEDTGRTSEPLPVGDNPDSRIPLMPSLTDKLMDSGEDLLKKADHLMLRLSSLLNDENEKNIGGILGNLKSLTDKLSALQISVDKALQGVPALTDNAQKTLNHINALTGDLQNLTAEVRKLSSKTNQLLATGQAVGDRITETTVPNVNALLSEIQSTSKEIKHLAEMLETDPQSVLLGPKKPMPGPGEPGFEDDR
jgi:phospholipid/cholesterol/gamma-HCH transport system substrate-binding protein